MNHKSNHLLKQLQQLQDPNSQLAQSMLQLLSSQLSSNSDFLSLLSRQNQLNQEESQPQVKMQTHFLPVPQQEDQPDFRASNSQSMMRIQTNEQPEDSLMQYLGIQEQPKPSQRKRQFQQEKPARRNIFNQDNDFDLEINEPSHTPLANSKQTQLADSISLKESKISADLQQKGFGKPAVQSSKPSRSKKAGRQQKEQYQTINIQYMPNEHDQKPICSSSKNFDALLRKKLMEEGQYFEQQIDSEEKQQPRKTSFLKRGEGKQTTSRISKERQVLKQSKLLPPPSIPPKQLPQDKSQRSAKKKINFFMEDEPQSPSFYQETQRVEHRQQSRSNINQYISKAPPLPKKQKEKESRREAMPRNQNVQQQLAALRLQEQRLAKIRKQYQTNLKSLQTAQEEFSKEKEEFENFKRNEVKRISDQSRVSERQRQAFNSAGPKKNEEFQKLKKDYDRLLEQSKRRESNDRIYIKKLQKQCENLKKGSSAVPSVQPSEEQNRKPNFQKRSSGSSLSKEPSKGSVKQSREAKQVVVTEPKGSAQKKIQRQKPASSSIKSAKVQQAQDQWIYDNSEEQQTSKQYTCKLQDLALLNHLSVSMVGHKIAREQFSYSQNKYYKNYLKPNSKRQLLSQQYQDGIHFRLYSDDRKELLFESGAKKEMIGDYVIVHFQNRDVKQELPQGIQIYYFSSKDTTQITLPSGVKIFKFYHGQIEFHFPEGRKEVIDKFGNTKVFSP